ncbi:MAG: hypothetical protein EOO27_23445, partial [Comamonadaceae bacterium]
MPHKIYRHPKTAVYWVRAHRPSALNHLPGTKDFRRSTGQRDRKKAEAVGADMAAAQWKLWLELLQDPLEVDAVPTPLSSELRTELCALRLYAWLNSDDDLRRQGMTPLELAEGESHRSQADKEVRAVLTLGRGAQTWQSVAEDAVDWAARHGYELRESDPLLTDYVLDFAKAEADAHEAIALRNQGRSAPTPERPKKKEVHTLSSIVPLFLEHKGTRKDTKEVRTMVNAWKLFVEYCGDVPFDVVTSNHVYGFMVARMAAGGRLAWSHERAHGFGQRTLHQVFGLARTKQMMTAPNPVPDSGLEAFPPKDAEENLQPRLPFSVPQLNQFFTSAWYDPNEENAFRGKMRHDLGARYWTPLIGLCHGNRVREGVQLVASDVVKEDGVLVLKYRVEVDGDKKAAEPLRSLKTKSTARGVPVHPKLLELGFESFVEERRQQEGPNAWLFPSCLPDPDSKSPKLGRAYEQAFLRFVRDRLGFGHGFGNHSFRHLLEDLVRDAQARNGVWPAGLSQKYTGRETVREQDKSVIRGQG